MDVDNDVTALGASQPAPKSSILKGFYIITFFLIPAISIFAFSFPQNKRITSVLHRAANATSFVNIRTHPAVLPYPPFTLFSTHVILYAHQNPTAAYICIDENGTISNVATTLLRIPPSFRHNVIDMTPLVIMPGLIDPHVHINSPGRDEWEGFDTAMRASAVGGTTTMLDMPINGMPATVDLPSHAKKVRSLMESSAVVNVGLIGGVVPQNVHDLSDLLNAGVLALKSFLVDTQSPDFHMVSTQDLRAAMSFLHSWQTTNPSHRRIPYIIHAEIDDNAPDSGLRAAMDHSFDHSNYSAYEVTRPGTWETAAVAEVISAVNGSQVHAHIAHVSSAEVTDQIRAARDGGLNSALITAETCPHYLLFAKEEIPYGATLFKCSPPIRSSANRARLLREVFSRDVSRRVIDIVASDHSPSASELKETEGNLTSAWGGIAGLQYRLQATLQAAQMAASEEKVSVVEISRLLSETPARLFGLDDVKGSISPGKDADIVIWDPNVDYTVLPEDCEHRVKHSAFDGRTLRGKVWYTLVRGHAVFYRSADGERHIHKGHGRYLKKDRMGQIQQEDIIKVV